MAKAIIAKTFEIAAVGPGHWQRVHDAAQARFRSDPLPASVRRGLEALARSKPVPPPQPPQPTKKTAAPMSEDASRATINTIILKSLTQEVLGKLAAAGVGYDGSLQEKATKVAAEALPF